MRKEKGVNLAELTNREFPPALGRRGQLEPAVNSNAVT
jgi:hypothetical protein